ncbi:hypothetical protein CYL20_25175 [Pseudomonas palleroniana]|uniref:HEPN AbiU2-like domain-containing protein n=1 Tax=Pseudomonas palleroniana TaxID=191390 RepID=A0A2L1JH12_9PSED|nr:hypothetical protein [Pseudomonas palleroniana]AVE07716.1 hypothetical protein CYL20_25175 [Pseudomonas palleroniana]
MDHIQQEIERLKSIVDTAKQEIDLAVMFHETWRPAAYDTGLHARIGTSYASHAFQIIRLSLRRELLMALMRVWDKNQDAVRLTVVAERLRNGKFFEALVQYRTERIGLHSRFSSDAMRKILKPRRDQVVRLIYKYGPNGKAYGVFEKLKKLRDEQLAHRELPKVPIALAATDTPSQRDEEGKPPVWATNDEIETFYQDSLEIMRLLLSLVLGMAYDLSDATSVYKHHAKYFWASARGERTEGHPDYNPSPSGL